MKAIQEILKNLRSGTYTKPKETTEERHLRYMQEEIIKNKDKCPKCGGMGVIPSIQDGYEVVTICDCKKLEQAKKRIEKSGLSEVMKKQSIESFLAKEDWQLRIKQSAYKFLGTDGKWFFVGGQVGCGKTHICTGIMNELMKKGKSAYYMLWSDEVIKLKANKMNPEVYNNIINPIKTISVLYIDDFFKTEKDTKPSNADVMAAFEIINYRYTHGLVTLISSEKSIDDIKDIDEAIGSRIYQMSDGFRNVIRYEQGRNYRLRK